MHGFLCLGHACSEISNNYFNYCCCTSVLTVFICSLIFTLSYFPPLWQQAALVLNASRRFRYTLDLKKEEEKEQIRRKIRAHAALAIMACTAMILIGGDIDTNVTCHECHVHVQYI